MTLAGEVQCNQQCGHILEKQKHLGLLQHCRSNLEEEVPQIDQDTPLKEIVELDQRFHSSLPGSKDQHHCRRYSRKLFEWVAR